MESEPLVAKMSVTTIILSSFVSSCIFHVLVFRFKQNFHIGN